MTAQQSHDIQIKEEELGEIDELSQSDAYFTPFDTNPFIKEEKCDMNDFEGVIYQSLPWENVINKSAQHNVYILNEFDENTNIKTEIEVEEAALQPKIEQLNQVESNSTFSATSTPRKTKSAQIKLKTKTTKKKSSPNSNCYQCEYCSEKTKTIIGLINHQRRHIDLLPFECRVCTRHFNENDERKEHESTCTMRRFECHLCRFTSLHAHWNRFMVHIRKHTGEQPFACKCCTKQFTSKRMLNHHMKYHPNEILSKCSFCQRRFVSSADAKEHESKCALQRQMECYLCKSSFTYRSSLRRHMPQHTGLTTFNCKYCNKGYARKEYLDTHLMTDHTNELQFSCTICKQRFSQKTATDEHMQFCTKKTLFKCDLCNYSTISKTYAEDHKQKHIGSDEFKCWHCSEMFLQRSKLVQHVKTHNKKSKFKCPYCDKAYDRWLFMEKHRNVCSLAPSSSINK